MDIKDFLKAKEKLNSRFRKSEISRQELNKAMTKLRNSRDAARKGRLEKTPLGRFVNWLTTPAPLSAIIEPLKGPALKKKDAAGSKGGPGRPAGTGQKPAAKPKRKAPKFDPTGMKLPKAKPKTKPKAKAKTEKKFTQIDVQTGKPKFDAPKVSAAVRLKQEDRYKVNKKIRDAATKSMKKKKG